MGTLNDNSRKVAEAFVDARRTWTALSVYPGLHPASLSQAYEIQDMALKIDGRVPQGWKVGRIADELATVLGTTRLSGPIFAETIVDAQKGDRAAMPVFAPGFAAVEAEFLVRIRSDWSGEVPADDGATLALIETVHVGIEIASSPYAAINEDGPLVTISDFGNNAGLVVGPSLGDPSAIDFDAIAVMVAVDDEIVGPSATTATMLDGPLGAVRFLLGNLAERGLVRSGGFWISTGAVTGVHPVKPGVTAHAFFGSDLRLDCRITSP